MKKSIFPFIIAIAFTACSEGDGGNNNDNPNEGIGCGELMSMNLNDNVAGSVCYNNKPENCTKYGRLYDWATAMALPAKCNSIFSTSDPDCAIQSNHKGICPDGQHIPSLDELRQYGSNECLKNQLGGIGEDDYFGYAGTYGLWWSTLEDSEWDYGAIGWWYNNKEVISRLSNKPQLFSVRCIKD
jgi:hypothetical protein